MIVRPLIPQQSTVNGKRKVISRYEEGGEAAKTGIAEFIPFIKNKLTDIVNNPTLTQTIQSQSLGQEEAARVKPTIQGAAVATAGLTGDIYEAVKQSPGGQYLAQSIPYFKYLRGTPTTTDVEESVESLGLKLPKDSLDYKAGQFFTPATLVGIGAFPYAAFRAGMKVTPEIKEKLYPLYQQAQELTSPNIVPFTSPDLGLVTTAGKISKEKDISETLGKIRTNLKEKGSVIDIEDVKSSTKGDSYLESEKMNEDFRDLQKGKEKEVVNRVTENIKDVSSNLKTIAEEATRDKNNLFGKYKKLFKKNNIELNPEVENNILRTYIFEGGSTTLESGGKASKDDFHWSLSELLKKKHPEIYEKDMSHYKMTDNAGNSLEPVVDKIFTPLLKDLQELDNYYAKRVTPFLKKLSPYNFDISLDEGKKAFKTRVMLSDLKDFFSDIPSYLGDDGIVRFTERTRAFPNPILGGFERKLILNFNELDQILNPTLKGSATRSIYLDNIIEKIPNATKNSIVDTFLNKYMKWYQTTAGRDVFAKGETDKGGFTLERFKAPTLGFSGKGKTDKILQNLFDGKINFSKEFLDNMLEQVKTRLDSTYNQILKERETLKDIDFKQVEKKYLNIKTRLDNYLNGPDQGKTLNEIFPLKGKDNEVGVKILDTAYTDFIDSPQKGESPTQLNFKDYLLGKGPILETDRRSSLTTIPENPVKDDFAYSFLDEPEYFGRYESVNYKGRKPVISSVAPNYTPTEIPYEKDVSDTVQKMISKDLFQVEGIKNQNFPGNFITRLVSAQDDPYNLEKILKALQRISSGEIYKKINPDYVESVAKKQERLMKAFPPSFSSDTPLSPLERGYTKGLTTRRADEERFNLPFEDSIFSDLKGFFGVEDVDIYSFFRDAAKNKKNLEGSSFDEIASDIILRAEQRLKRSPTRVLSKDYYKIKKANNPLNVTTKGSKRSWLEIDDDLTSFNSFVKQKDSAIEIVEKINEGGGKYTSGSISPRSGDKFYTAVDPVTGAEYVYEPRKGIKTTKDVFEAEKEGEYSFRHDTKEDVARNVKASIIGEKLKNCIGSQCQIVGPDQKLFVLTSKKNLEPYFAIKISKSGRSDGKWKMDSGEFLGVENNRVGDNRFTFPPELRKENQRDSQASVLRDIVELFNHLAEKGIVVARDNFETRVKNSFEEEDLIEIFDKYKDIDFDAADELTMYKFKDGGEVRGVGALSYIARNMFKQPQGVVTLSSVARNMFI
jgi:hypothetical protein